MNSKLLRRLMDDSALELLLIMAQHVSHVRCVSSETSCHFTGCVQRRHKTLH